MQHAAGFFGSTEHLLRRESKNKKILRIVDAAASCHILVVYIEQREVEDYRVELRFG